MVAVVDDELEVLVCFQLLEEREPLFDVRAERVALALASAI